MPPAPSFSVTRYRDMVLPIMVSVLPGGGDEAMEFVEPVEHNVDLRRPRLVFALFDHDKSLAVGRDRATEHFQKLIFKETLQTTEKPEPFVA